MVSPTMSSNNLFESDSSSSTSISFNFNKFRWVCPCDAISHPALDNEIISDISKWNRVFPSLLFQELSFPIKFVQTKTDAVKLYLERMGKAFFTKLL